MPAKSKSPKSLPMVPKSDFMKELHEAMGHEAIRRLPDSERAKMGREYMDRGKKKPLKGSKC